MRFVLFLILIYGLSFSLYSEEDKIEAKYKLKLEKLKAAYLKEMEEIRLDMIKDYMEKLKSAMRNHNIEKAQEIQKTILALSQKEKVKEKVKEPIKKPKKTLTPPEKKSPKKKSNDDIWLPK